MNILIFREILLPITETFIFNQAFFLKKFNPHFIGLRKDKKDSIALDYQLTVNEGGIFGVINEVFFKILGYKSHALKKKIKKISPVLCHAHFGTDAIYALDIVALSNIPLIVTFHGYDATSVNNASLKGGMNYKLKKYLKNKERLINRTSIFIAVSEYIKQELLKQGFPKEKVFVHYIGVDTHYFIPNTNQDRKNVILFVGRLVEKKGLIYLIKAMSLLSIKHPNVELLIIGDGPLRDELENEASRKLKKYCFMGNQPPAEVKLQMQYSKVLCVPSIVAKNGDSEGFGMVFAEAQAVGTPVVSFRSGGVEEAVAHNKTGFLAEEKNWVELSMYLEILLIDENKWDQFSDEGINRIRNEFDLSKQNAKLEKLYHKTIYKN